MYLIKMYILLLLNGVICIHMEGISGLQHCSILFSISIWIIGLVVLPTVESGTLKSHTIVVDLGFFPSFNSVNVHFTHFGSLMFGAHMAIIFVHV